MLSAFYRRKNHDVDAYKQDLREWQETEEPLGRSPSDWVDWWLTGDFREEREGGLLVRAAQPESRQPVSSKG